MSPDADTRDFVAEMIAGIEKLERTILELSSNLQRVEQERDALRAGLQQVIAGMRALKDHGWADALEELLAGLTANQGKDQ